MLELGQTRSGLDSLEVLITYMFQVIDPVNLEVLRAKIRELGYRTEEVAMTIAEHLHEEGLKEGIRKGRIDTLRSLLVFKFQTLGAEHDARLQAASPSASRDHFSQMFFASLEQIRALRFGDGP